MVRFSLEKRAGNNYICSRERLYAKDLKLCNVVDAFLKQNKVATLVDMACF